MSSGEKERRGGPGRIGLPWEGRRQGREGLGLKEKEREGCLDTNTGSRGRKEMQEEDQITKNWGLKSLKVVRD